MPACIARMIDDGSLRNYLGVVSREASGVKRDASREKSATDRGSRRDESRLRACLAASRKHERRATKVPTADRRWPQKC